ncbi:SnodProt1 [Vararia minispora EC-137]|uniref:SnodProt1 n=1 Tax=Vararia minispora EC-137 TaxID=1314806 RepID=A0ACB8QXT3_9AGAM|nr:SnodProt1 [Vararia minispora EC-137]
MKLSYTLTSLFAFASIAAAEGPIMYNVRWDATYDNPSGSLYGVACSTGPHGLVTAGYKVFRDLPTFPNLAAWQDASYGSDSCGTCWNITHDGVSALVTVIDKSGDGFNVAKSTYEELNHNDLSKGSFSATAFQVDKKKCGL